MCIQRKESDLVLAALQVRSPDVEDSDGCLPTVIIVPVHRHRYPADRTGDPLTNQSIIQLPQFAGVPLQPYRDDRAPECEQGLVEVARVESLHPAQVFSVEEFLKTAV